MERTPLGRFVLILLAAIGVLWLLDRALAIGAYFADILLLFFLAWLVAFIRSTAKLAFDLTIWFSWYTVSILSGKEQSMRTPKELEQTAPTV
ncbi:MAG: hypothetical protein FJZ89_14880, partial [Chloroflexi bacterium]|nr:hypothetical protein [Chloroflexota bacterium]